MNPAGKLVFDLTPDAQDGAAAAIRSSRPLQAARLLEGKPIDQVLKTIPLLFSICGKAQSAAAIRALEAALGVNPGPRVARRRVKLVELETLREHLWRILLDWPGFSDDSTTTKPGPTPEAAHLVQAVNALIKTVVGDGACLQQPGLVQTSDAEPPVADGMRPIRSAIEQQLFETKLDAWLEFDEQELQGWIDTADTPLTQLLRHVQNKQWSSLGSGDARPLPPLDGQELLTRLDAGDADGFVARPDWRGQTNLETGAFARNLDHPLITQLRSSYGTGLLVRLIARLIETAQCCARLSTDPDATGPDEAAQQPHSAPGLGVAEAARGRLYHRVRVKDGMIGYYRILAPTEWNFHPQGPAIQALSGIHETGPDPARRQAELLIHAIDPCVEYQIHIHSAGRLPVSSDPRHA